MTPIPQEQLVIVDLNSDGIANTTTVHLPTSRSNKGGFRFHDYDFPPATWPSKCGTGSGSVYVRAGLLEHAAICTACQEKK